jgi:hypothetical protein
VAVLGVRQLVVAHKVVAVLEVYSGRPAKQSPQDPKLSS